MSASSSAVESAARPVAIPVTTTSRAIVSATRETVTAVCLGSRRSCDTSRPSESRLQPELPPKPAALEGLRRSDPPPCQPPRLTLLIAHRSLPPHRAVGARGPSPRSPARRVATSTVRSSATSTSSSRTRAPVSVSSSPVGSSARTISDRSPAPERWRPAVAPRR